MKELDAGLVIPFAEALRRIISRAGLDEREWLWAATSNPAYAFLDDPAEDIYSLSDGKPFDLDR